MPTGERWLRITELAHDYGEQVMLCMRVYYEVAYDLLESRSSNYSDRLVTEMAKPSVLLFCLCRDWDLLKYGRR
jgi:hypothetical protein